MLNLDDSEDTGRTFPLLPDRDILQVTVLGDRLTEAPKAPKTPANCFSRKGSNPNCFHERQHQRSRKKRIIGRGQKLGSILPAHLNPSLGRGALAPRHKP